jgi:O-antigen/teichoic acid export membrane protein
MTSLQQQKNVANDPSRDAPKPATSTVRNVLANWGGLAATTVVSLILTPLLINQLGSFYFGLWVLVGSVTDYYGLLDVGMRSTLFRFVTRCKGNNDRQGLNEVMSSALAIVLSISAVVMALTVAMIPWIPTFFAVGASARPEFQKVMAILGLTVALLFPSQLFGTYLSGSRRFDLYNFSTSGANVLKLLLTIIALRMGFGIIGVAVATLLSSLVNFATNLVMVRRLDPDLRFSTHHVSRSRIRELFSFSFFAFLISIGDYLRFFTDSIVIGRVLSVALITPFSIASRLISLLRHLLYGVAAPLQGMMGELDGAGRQEELKRFVLRSLRLTGVLTCVLVSLLALNGDWLIRRWIGEGFNDSYKLLLVLLVGYLLAMSQQPFADLLLIKGRHQLRGWWSIAEGFANLGLSIYWGHKYGLIGVALGTTVPMLAVQILFQPWYALYVSEISISDYLNESIFPPLTAFIGVIAAGFALRTLAHPVGLVSQFGVALVECLIALILGWILVGADDRQMMMRRFGFSKTN